MLLFRHASCGHFERRDGIAKKLLHFCSPNRLSYEDDRHFRNIIEVNELLQKQTVVKCIAVLPPREHYYFVKRRVVATQSSVQVDVIFEFSASPDGVRF